MAVHTKIRIITSLHTQLVTVFAALLLVLANAGLTSATTIAEDDFNSYSDGFLVGQPGGGVGWERDWRNILEGTIVTNGHIQLDEATRVIRDLETPIGDTASDYGKTYTFSVDMEFGVFFTAFEGRFGGDEDTERTINLADCPMIDPQCAGDGQQLAIGSGLIDPRTIIEFPDMTGRHNFQIEVTFGDSEDAQDTAELFIDLVSQGPPVNIGPDFAVDNVGFGAFVEGVIPFADNLLITDRPAIPEPSTFVMLLGLMLTGACGWRRRV